MQRAPEPPSAVQAAFVVQPVKGGRTCASLASDELASEPPSPLLPPPSPPSVVASPPDPPSGVGKHCEMRFVRVQVYPDGQLPAVHPDPAS